MTLNQAGIDLIKKCEGCRLEPYLCPSGHWTIGIGHLIREGEKFTAITQDAAEALLRRDLEHISKDVAGCVKVPLNDNQFSALVSFAYNVGVGALRGSTLLKKLNAGDVEGAENEFLRWTKARMPNGTIKQLDGLVKRRTLESMLFALPK